MDSRASSQEKQELTRGMWVVGWFGDVDLDIVELGDLLVVMYQAEVRSSNHNGALTPVGFAPAAVSLLARFFAGK